MTHLCPDVAVVDVSRIEPLCRELTASVVNVSSLQEPIETLRSSGVVLPLDVMFDCTAPDGFTIETRYVYTAMVSTLKTYPDVLQTVN